MDGEATAEFDRMLQLCALRQSPDGQCLVTLALTKQSQSPRYVLHVWRRPGLGREHTLSIEGQVVDAAISSDSRWLAAAASPPHGTAHVLVWNLNSGDLVRALRLTGEPEFHGVVSAPEVRFQPAGSEMVARASAQSGQ